MMVSIFPYDGIIVTLDTKPMTISAKEQSLESVDFWATPTQPTAPVAIVDGAQMLTSTILASVVVFSTLL